MLTFWIIAALFVLLALWFVLPALLQKHDHSEEDERREANVLVYQDQYRELEADLKNGLLSVDLDRPEAERLVRKINISVKD